MSKVTLEPAKRSVELFVCSVSVCVCVCDSV